MKTRIFFLSLFSFAATFSFAQSSWFNKEISAWHKKAVMTCGMIKSPEALAKKDQIAKNLEEIGSGLENLAKTYKSNPPAEYKNDPLWGSYFEDLADNLTVVKYFTGIQQYRVASKTCSVFCQTFLRMHKNNGTTDLSDMLFSLNMQLKLTTDISNARNAKGAIKNAGMVKEILEHIAQNLKSTNDANISALMTPVEKTTQEWLKAIESSDAKSAKSLYAAFTPNFMKVFMASM